MALRPHMFRNDGVVLSDSMAINFPLAKKHRSALKSWPATKR